MEQFVDENNYPLFDGINGLKQERMSQTAMQSLITHLEMLNQRVSTVPVDSLIDTIKASYIHQEKEQMLAFADWYASGLTNSERWAKSIEEHYNTFLIVSRKQNK